MLAKLQGEDRIVKLFDYENDKQREVSFCSGSQGVLDQILLWYPKLFVCQKLWVLFEIWLFQFSNNNFNLEKGYFCFLSFVTYFNLSFIDLYLDVSNCVYLLPDYTVNVPYTYYRVLQ